MNIIAELNKRKWWIKACAWASRYGLASMALFVSIISLIVSMKGGCSKDKLTFAEKKSAAIVEAWNLERILTAHYVAVSNRYYNGNITHEDLNRYAKHLVEIGGKVDLIKSIRNDIYTDNKTKGSANLEWLCGRLRVINIAVQDSIIEWEQQYDWPTNHAK